MKVEATGGMGLLCLALGNADGVAVVAREVDFVDSAHGCGFELGWFG